MRKGLCDNAALVRPGCLGYFSCPATDFGKSDLEAVAERYGVSETNVVACQRMIG